MNIFRLFLVVVAISMYLPSCQSSKVAYGNSYYFSATPKPSATAPELYASTAPPSVSSQLPDLSAPSVIVPIRRITPVSAKQPQTSRKATRKARRAHRKAVRQQLRQWLKPAPQQANDTQATQRLEGLTKAGVITGAGALVMLLVGVLAGVSFLTAIGGILLGIAVVLILLDIL